MLFSLNRLCLGTLAVSLACSVMGAGLQEREEDIKQRSEAKKAADDEKRSPSGNDRGINSTFGSGTYPSASSASSGGFMSDFWGWLVMAPFAYQHDDPSGSMDGDSEGWADEKQGIFPIHYPGQATVPYVRFDYGYQWAEDVYAHDGRVEAGYKLVAFQGRFTRYTDSTDFSLNVSQYYGLLRYGGNRPDFLPGSFELNVGAGVAQHSGDIAEDDTSGAFTLGMKYYPVEWAGFEFRPAFYRWDEIFIRDYDLSMAVGLRHIMFRGGYRWLWDQGVVDVQSGFYAGLL